MIAVWLVAGQAVALGDISPMSAAQSQGCVRAYLAIILMASGFDSSTICMPGSFARRSLRPGNEVASAITTRRSPSPCRCISERVHMMHGDREVANTVLPQSTAAKSSMLVGLTMLLLPVATAFSSPSLEAVAM